MLKRFSIMNDTEVPYVERLRRSAIKPGTCSFCGSFVEVPEFHHECYRPERGLQLCHKCHHKAHFLPYQLSIQEKEKLLFHRLGPLEFNRRRAKPTDWARELSKYIAPGRRDAQLRMRRERIARDSVIHSEGVGSRGEGAHQPV